MDDLNDKQRIMRIFKKFNQILIEEEGGYTDLLAISVTFLHLLAKDYELSNIEITKRVKKYLDKLSKENK